jgi:NTP pyrophosphatase (non-canonical NTP hydrolase)
VLARQRQKGCDGLGEMTNLKDELREVLDDLLAYCKGHGYGHLLDEKCDIDLVADKIVGMKQ